MDKAELLRSTVAEFLKLDPAQLSAASPLAGKRLQSSLGRAALDAAIRRRLQLQCPAVYSAKTYGDLEKAVLGESTLQANNGAAASNAPAPLPDIPSNGLAGPKGLACGIDVEAVAGFPAVADHWEDEFYRANFTAAEISYCLLQAQPSMHFAARWCAKEALKKCDARYLQEKMVDVELTLGAAGAPTLSLIKNKVRQALPVAVSLSHTPELAIAVVVQASLPMSAPPLPAVAAAAQPSDAGQQQPVALVLLFLLSLLTLGLVIWALVRTF